MSAPAVPRPRGEVLVVDFSNLAARAWFTLRDPSLEKLPRKVSTMLTAAVRRWSPAHLILALDAPRSFRHDLIPHYKAERAGRDRPSTEAMTGALRPYFARWGVATREAVGMEADDVVAAVVASARANQVPAAILSRDTDLLQLVDDAAMVRVLWPSGGKEGEQPMGEAAVVGYVGVPPGKLLDLRTMVGGKDNLPRIEVRAGKPPYGFTERRAVQLLGEQGATLDALYGEMSWLLTHKETAWMAACREEALARREALRLRDSFTPIATGATAVVRLQLAGVPAARPS